MLYADVLEVDLTGRRDVSGTWGYTPSLRYAPSVGGYAASRDACGGRGVSGGKYLSLLGLVLVGREGIEPPTR